MSDTGPSIPRSLAGLVIVLVAFGLTFILGLTVFAMSDVVPVSMYRAAIPAFLLVELVLPLGAAIAVSRWLGRRGWFSALATVRRPKWLVAALIAGYTLTAAFGVPAVQTHTNSWAVKEYKRLRAAGDTRVWEAHPYIATYLAVPILPGVVLTYHEYQLDGLYGFGGFQLFAWYGAGVRELWALPLWLS